MASVPWNIRGSASQLFYQDKQSFQYQALLAITDLPHPDRSILGAFINDAVDPEKAGQYLLRMASAENSKTEPKKTLQQLLFEWKALIGKFRPTQAKSISDETKRLIYERDGACCCLTQTPFKSHLDERLEYVQMVNPFIFADPDLTEAGVLSDMLLAFLSEKVLEDIRSVHQTERVDNLWLLSKDAFHAVEKGLVYFKVQSWGSSRDVTRKQNYMVATNVFTPQPSDRRFMSVRTITLQNRTPDVTPIPNENILNLHARFSKSLSWIDAKKYMDMISHDCVESGILPSFFISPLFRAFRSLWTALPSFVRIWTYNRLLWIGSHLYGRTLSMTVYKLPFGLYLRKGSPNLAAKYSAEFHTLRMVEQWTHIPAPRAIDVLQTQHHSYLLMSSVPGRPIGPMLNTMTDDQINQVVIDLKRYVSELREIPNPHGYQICNSKGGGILDYRIPESQRTELRFKSESDFNKCLTNDLRKEVRDFAAKSHDIPHDIVFTHGDLNPRNILAVNGKITGIVDWENAGWFPEYWEYTKAHYSVRSVIRWLADVVDRVFEGYRDELVVENALSDAMGPF